MALAAAALCALLAQWQLGRSIRVTNDPNTIDTAIQLSTITQPGKAVTDKLADKRAFETVKVEANSCVVVENRYQLNDDGTSTKGFWVLSDSTDTMGAHLWLAHGFSSNEKQPRMSAPAAPRPPKLTTASSQKSADTNQAKKFNHKFRPATLRSLHR